MLVQLFGYMTHPFWCWLLVKEDDPLGGLARARCCSDFVVMVILFITIFTKKYFKEIQFTVDGDIFVIFFYFYNKLI